MWHWSGVTLETLKLHGVSRFPTIPETDAPYIIINVHPPVCDEAVTSKMQKRYREAISQIILNALRPTLDTLIKSDNRVRVECNVIPESVSGFRYDSDGEAQSW